MHTHTCRHTLTTEKMTSLNDIHLSTESSLAENALVLESDRTGLLTRVLEC